MPIDWPGEKLIIKIWETLADKGVGGLLRPWQIKREAKARTEARKEELLLMERTRQDIKDLRKGNKIFGPDGNILPAPKPIKALPAPKAPGSDTEPMGMIVMRQEAARQLEHAINIRKIGLYAEEEAETMSGQQASDESIDPDWFERWYETAKTVSSEDLQRIWARVLAGELRQPKSYSFHTLDFIRRMSKEDAELVSQVAPFLISDFIFRHKEFLENKELDMGRLMDLQELGVVSGVEALGLESTISPQIDGDTEIKLKCHDRILFIRADAAPIVLRFPIYRVSKLGLQLLSLGSFKSNLEYLKLIAESIKAQGFKVKIAEIVPSAIPGKIGLSNLRDF